MNQLDSGHTRHSGVADDQMALLQRDRQLDGGKAVVGVKDGMPFLPERLDHERDHCLVFVGDENSLPLNAGRASEHTL